MGLGLTAAGYQKITINGEVTYDRHTGMYTVWDEVYSEPVLETPSKGEALKKYGEYCEYLAGPL